MNTTGLWIIAYLTAEILSALWFAKYVGWDWLPV